MYYELLVVGGRTQKNVELEISSSLQKFLQICVYAMLKRIEFYTVGISIIHSTF